MKEKEKKYKSINKKILISFVSYIALLGLFIAIMLVFKSKDADYQKCIKDYNLTGNCGVGALCYSECEPSNYMTIELLHAAYNYFLFPFLITPMFIFSYLYCIRERNKIKK